MNPDTTNPPQPMNTPSPAPAPTPAPEKSGMGGVIALVIIVLALLAGGYFLMGKMKTKQLPESIPTATTQTAPTTDSAPEAAAVDPNTIQGTGTDVADIEKDLNATDLDTLSADLNAI